MKQQWGAFAARLTAATLVAGCSFTLPAIAHEADDVMHTHDKVKVSDPERYRSPRRGAFELRLGPYRPRIDSEFSGPTPYQDAYGQKRALSPGIEGDYSPLHIPHFGSLGVGLGWHWFNRKSTAEFSSGDAGSAHPDRLWIMPMYAVAVLRLDVLKRDLHIPLVPYAKGGFALGLWEARDAKELSTVSGVKGRGLETGLQFQLGAMVHLNPLAPQTALDMDNSSGVNDAYLFFEWWVSDVDSFGRGMQVGVNTWVMGAAIEY